jgi:hypothetical protein
LSRLAGLLGIREKPHRFNPADFILYDKLVPIEEFNSPLFHQGRFYAVEIGQMFRNRWQVIAKLGSGNYSTIWLARDLKSVVF